MDDKLPDIHFGGFHKVNWRRHPEFYDPDDDAELPTTPKHVVELLGYDPLEKEPHKR